MPIAGRWLLYLVLWLLPGIASAQAGSVQAELSSGTIAVDESVTLSVTARDADGVIDTTELEQMFDVVSRSQSQQVSIVNGVRSNITTWALELVPRSVGVFTVPAVTVGSGRSQLLTLTVDAAPTGSARQVFVETSISKASPWVQEQTILTLKVFQSVDVLDGSLDEPQGDGLLIVPLEDRKVLDEVRDGIEFRVTEIRFAVFAQRSGTARLQPVTLVASVPAAAGRSSAYQAPTRRLTRRSEPLDIAVLPRPADSGGQWWLPATDVTLSDSWSNGIGSGALPDDRSTLRVGEPVMRTITLSGNGVIDTQLPSLAIPDVEGLRIYEDAVELDREVGDAGVRSRQQITWSIRPERVGTVEVPAIRVQWFDTVSSTTRTAQLPARTITVLPALADQGDSDMDTNPDQADGTMAADATDDDAVVAPASASDTSPDSMSAGADELDPLAESAPEADTRPLGWQRWAVALPLTLALALSTLVLLWRARRRQGTSNRFDTVQSPAAATRRHLLACCQQDDVDSITRAILAWAGEVWPLDSPRSLAALAQRLPDEPDDPAVQACHRVLAELDAARYSPQPASGLIDAESLQAFPARLDDVWRLMHKRSIADRDDACHLPAL